MTTRASSSRMSEVIRFGLIGICLFLCLLACFTIRQEGEIIKAQRRIDLRQIIGAGNDGHSPPLPFDSALPPRVSIANALLTAQDAAFIRQPGNRAAFLSHAQEEIRSVANARPYWGDAQVIQAFIASQQSVGLDNAIAFYSASYHSNRYLKAAAAWRVRFGIEHWAKLDHDIQKRMIDEAVWLIRMKPNLRDDIFDITRGTDSYVPLMLRWRQVRMKDENFFR